VTARLADVLVKVPIVVAPVPAKDSVAKRLLLKALNVVRPVPPNDAVVRKLSVTPPRTLATVAEDLLVTVSDVAVSVVFAFVIASAPVPAMVNALRLTSVKVLIAFELVALALLVTFRVPIPCVVLSPTTKVVVVCPVVVAAVPSVSARLSVAPLVSEVL